MHHFDLILQRRKFKFCSYVESVSNIRFVHYQVTHETSYNFSRHYENLGDEQTALQIRRSIRTVLQAVCVLGWLFPVDGISISEACRSPHQSTATCMQIGSPVLCVALYLQSFLHPHTQSYNRALHQYGKQLSSNGMRKLKDLPGVKYFLVNYTQVKANRVIIIQLKVTIFKSLLKFQSII